MAWTGTERQILLAIEMADIPAGQFIYKMDQLGLNATEFAALNGPTSAVTAMRAVMASLSTDQQAIVVEIITAYEGLRITAAGVTGGSPQSVPGSGVNFQERIAEYKKLIKCHIPFWTSWETMQSDRAAVRNAVSYCGVMC
jgi:hypothetical protein